MDIFLRYRDGSTSVIRAVQWYRPVEKDLTCVIKTYGNDPAVNRDVTHVDVMAGEFVCLDRAYAERHLS